MHVKDLHVTRYGPMRPFQYDGLGAFSVFFGPNEQGKTLLIDALFKMLFKKELKKSKERRFGNMKRVSEQPEGYVVLRTHADEVKLEGDDTISAVAPVSIDPDDFLNVFLIRDSDLRVVEERDYYARITERLTGLRSSEIESLLRIVQNKGRLRSIAPDSALANSAEQGKVADRVRAVERLIDEVRSLRDKLAFERYDEMAEELFEARRARRALEEERERARAAETRRQFERARAALAELEDLEKQLSGMRGIDAEKLTRWRRAVVEREHLEKDVERGERVVEAAGKQLERGERELGEKRTKADEAERRHRDAESALAERLDAYQRDRLEFRRGESMAGLARKTFYASAVVVAMGLVAYAIAPSNVVATVGGLALLVALRTGWSVWSLHHRRGKLEQRAEELCADASRRGVRVDSVLDLQSALGDLERDARTLRDEERAHADAVARARTDFEKQRARIAEWRTRIAEIVAEVASLEAATGAASLDAYQAAVDRHKSLEASRAARRELLQGLVPVDGKGATAVDQWRAAIEDALSAEETGHDAVDPDRIHRIDREIKELTAREHDAVRRLAKGDKQLYAVQMKAADLKVLDEVVRCRVLGDLDHLAARLEDYCRAIAHEQEVAQSVIGVFLDIDAEERERVGDLFGPAAPVSRLFREITGGRYRSVTYDVEQDQIYVEQNDGKAVRASALSGGAFDQLYLAIRLSVAEKLLPGAKGFFIMDDPFIKADRARLARMMDTLRRFVREGWQVLYFTAKQEVLDALSPDIAAGDVRLVEFDRDLFAPPLWDDTHAAPSQKD